MSSRTICPRLRSRPGRRACLLFAAGAVLAADPALSLAQLRIADYNTGGDCRSGMSTILQAIGNESRNGIAKPIDILTLEEQETSASTTQAIVSVLNSLYGAGTYARTTIDVDSTGSGRPELIYNTHTVQLISQTAVGTTSSSGQARQGLRVQLRPVGYDSAADFYVYVDHYKASSGSTNETRRNIEAQAVRANADALGPNASILYTGDLNLYSNAEPAYKTLIASGNGQATDPLGTGDWTGVKIEHTQSPTTTSHYGGQVTGGMNDRFDFQLPSTDLADGHGLDYIPGSYHAFGNNGTHTLNGAISTGTGASPAVLSALESTSDHIPVVSDYQLPAKMSVTAGSVPSMVIRGAAVSLPVTVTNVAPVSFANGADKLDYTITGSGALAGTTTGSANALAAGNTHNLALNTSAAGSVTGQVGVTSSSQQVANGSFSTAVQTTVLDHANASFSASSDQNALTIDFGQVAQGSGILTQSQAIWNLTGMAGFTAALDLDSITPSGDTSVLASTLSTFKNLTAAGNRPFSISFDTSRAGTFLATYSLGVSDQDLPGASAASLTVTLSGHVVAPANQWASPTGGNWATSTNWTNGLPSGPGAIANFYGNITAPATVSIDSPTTTGAINFASSNAYTLAGNSSVALSAASGPASVRVTQGRHTIAVPMTLQSDTAIDIAADCALSTSAMTGAAGTTLIKTGAGPLTIAAASSLAGLDITAGTITLAENRVTTLRVTHLSIGEASTLDISNNALILDYTGSPSPLAQIQGEVARGAGGGIISSTVGHDPEGLAVLGVIDNADLGASEFAGQAVPATAVLVRYTIYGDADLSGGVTADDYSLIDTGYLSGLSGWLFGDFNSDGVVNADDYALMDINYLAQTSSLAAQHASQFGAAYATIVPEPATLAVLSLTSLALLRRQRRQGRTPLM